MARPRRYSVGFCAVRFGVAVPGSVTRHRRIRICRRQGAEQEADQQSGSIKRLSRDVVEKLAAGEVIPNLTAAVREVVENSIDAGATEIELDIDRANDTLVFKDNGTGMSVQDLRNCTRFNFTSKISTVKDIQLCQTLGFRGQGLAALSKQSKQLLIFTRQGNDQSGFLMASEWGTPSDPIQFAASPGTKLVVKQLSCGQNTDSFCAKEVKKAICWLESAALSHKQYSARVRVSGHASFLISSRMTTAQSFHRILHRRTRRTMARPDDFVADSISFEGFTVTLTLGMPDKVQRSRSDLVLVAVNRRVVQLDVVSQELLDIMRDWLPRTKYPAALIEILCDSTYVDWNIAPSKEVVRLSCVAQVTDRLPGLVKSCLGKRTRPWQSTEMGPEAYSIRGWVDLLNLDKVASTSAFKSLPITLRRTDGSAGEDHSPKASKEYKCLGQIYDNYVLVQTNGSLLLIEQHTAHERIIFESLQSDLKETRSQWKTRRRVKIECSDEIAARWAKCGIDVLPLDSNDGFDIRGGPRFLEQADDVSLTRILMALANESLDKSRSSPLSYLIADVACRMAFKNGATLSATQVANLADDFMKLGCPPTCPHGRPTIVELATKEQLARDFQRKWRLRGTLEKR